MDAESVTLNVSGVEVTATDGVPLTTPVDAFSVKPVGNVPAVSCQVKGVVPPAARRVCEYAVPTTPFARDVVVTVSTGGAIVRLKLTLAVCAVGEPESVTLKVSGVAVTGVLGVPLIKPVDAFSDNPAGKVPAVTCHV